MQELEKLKLAIEKAGNAVYEWDVDKDKITWSGDIHNILGLDKKVKLDSKEQFTQFLHKQDKEKYLTSLKSCLSAGGDYNKTYRLCPSEKKVVQIWDRGTLVKSGKKRYLIGIINRNEQKVDFGALDPVLSNKVSTEFYSASEYFNGEFRDKLIKEFKLAEKSKKNSVLLKISIDNLPMMMTWYTLEFAERIMSSLEIEIKKLIRKEDTVSRISLNQFGVILRNHSKGEADLVIDRILRHIQLYKNPSFDEPIHLRTSIGSVSFPGNASNADDALNKSYLALSSAKNRTSEFHCDYEDAKRDFMNTKDQIAQIHYMQNAFRENRMQLAYQPLVECGTGHVNKYECLLRIQNEDRRITSAGHFIPIAEKMGVIDMVDRFVMETVIEELKQNPEISLSFNVSNMTTDNPKWLKMCTKLLQDSSVASRVIVEVTETAAHRDMRQTAYFVAALQSLGCKVALDDFGAGYTSFRQLKSLSMDMVKIDGSYITNLAESSENFLFIKTLLNFNHSYGLETVAECVESGEIAKILIDLGIDYMQGYYFGKPDVARPWAHERPSYEEQIKIG